MRIAVLHNAIVADAPPEDQDTLVQVAAISQSLTRLGHIALPIACTLDLEELRATLREARPELVFNLVESLAGVDSLLYLPVAVLDAMGLPYTGSRTEALFLSANKLLSKQRMHQAGLPTPAWIETGDTGVPSPIDDDSRMSWILKGIWEQGSRGMGDDSVLMEVRWAEVLERLTERIATTGRPAFAEQFIPGREFNVSVLGGPTGPETLPPAEMCFHNFPEEKPQIVGHQAKWEPDSFEYRNTVRTFDFSEGDGPLLGELSHLAKDCWQLFGLRGWARVDFRVDHEGHPWILEVNANPCLAPDAGFAAALERGGWSFDEGVARILADV